MLALVLAAALAVSPPTDMTRSLLTDVCLPYVTGEARDTVALESLGFVSVPAPEEDTLRFQSEDEAWLLRLTTTGSADEGNLNRVCVIQARTGGLNGARSAVQPVLSEQGFAPDADQPADRPIWTRGGVTVSVRQNEGRAALIRVTYSSLDAG